MYLRFGQLLQFQYGQNKDGIVRAGDDNINRNEMALHLVEGVRRSRKGIKENLTNSTT